MEHYHNFLENATKELQLRRCIAYCLFNDFAICNIEQFVEDADLHFSKSVHKNYIKNCPYIYFSCNNPENICKQFEPDNRVPELSDLILENYEKKDVFECRSLLEYYAHGSTLCTYSPRYDINRESGTFWFSVVSDILLNIPELKIELWEKFGIKKNDKNLLSSFINSTNGNHIFNVYTKRIISRNHNITLASDNKNYVMKPSNNGYPEELMACIRIEAGLYLLKSTTYKHYKKARDLLDLVVSISNGDTMGVISDEVNNFWNRMEYYAKKIQRFRGSILTGFEKECCNGHSLSICKTPFNTLDIFNRGVKVKKEYLYEFFEKFNHYVTLTMYEYPI